MNKNVNRDYLVKVNVKTAEIETPKDDMIFYVTDIWTSNIFFQLDFGKGNSLTDLHNENASNYDLTLRVVKPNKEHKEIKASLLSQDSNFFVADLKPDFTDYIGICKCELFIETSINGRKETNTTDPFEYIVEGSVFSALDEVIEGNPDYPLVDTLATKEYVDAAVAAGVGSGIDLSGYVTTESMNASLATKANTDHTHTDLVVTNSISMGREEGTTVGNRSTAVGYRVIASHYSHAEGYQTTASGSSSHAEGASTKATGGNSHAEGASTKASGNSSHAEGSATVASGEGSHAEGIHTTASGFGSHAEGRDTIAASKYQHVEGRYNIKDTTDKYAHIVGNGENIGSSDYLSNAYTLDWSGNGWYAGNIYVGGTSQDTGKKLATEEYVDNAVGGSVDLSGYVTTEAMNTALSNKSNTNHTHSNYATSNNPNFTGTISGNDKFAVGKYVSATGNYSYAQGLGYEYYDDITEVYEEIYVLASGAASHAEGYGTQAKSSCQHVQGKLNIPDIDNRYAHIVGNGTDEFSKSNAHTLDWNGNGWYKGNLYVGGTSQDNANKVLSTADIKFTSDGKLSVTINGVTKKFNPA